MPEQFQRCPLRISGRAYIASGETRALLDKIGGTAALQRLTTVFYHRVFRNPHLAQFFTSSIEQDAMRLAFWIAEKMGGDHGPPVEGKGVGARCAPEQCANNDLKTRLQDDAQVREVGAEDLMMGVNGAGAKASLGKVVQYRGTTHGVKECPEWVRRHPWTYEREKHRDLTPRDIAVPRRDGSIRLQKFTVHDRSTAHFAAWHSKNRSVENLGQHFQLDDALAWLRLQFWACKTCGLFPADAAVADADAEARDAYDRAPGRSSPPPLDRETQLAFRDWFTRFLAHFIRVYEQEAPPFAAWALAWSDEPARLHAYTRAVAARQHGMADVIGKSVSDVRRAMSPQDAALYTQVKATGWPYNTNAQAF
eukprot:TRINITY_DN3502_c1_g1_i1.p1 TRINITY_DN3502_c1_g1~~TRINITY_DN3502_c1_g1_i1.p1  ORF type:complete len:365 (+),score=78.65 TRINITY_DN3502_c1_g1_i1:67-1161(+)